MSAYSQRICIMLTAAELQALDRFKLAFGQRSREDALHLAIMLLDRADIRVVIEPKRDV